jgi:CBS domain containing-hemolysin-like protein
MEQRIKKTERLKKAGELMIPLEKYPHVPYWFSLRQVAAVMEKTKIQADVPGGPSLAPFVLVFNETYNLLGITRRRDILRGLNPPSQARRSAKAEENGSGEKGAPGLPQISFDRLLERLCEQAERPVSEVMSPIQATIDYEDHILKVIQEMVEKNLSLLPVLKENMIVGVVRSAEVFQEIANLIL